MQKKIIIIGGGIAGLTAAYALRERGINSTIYEKCDRPGGLCKSFSIKDAWFDLGGHVVFTNDDYVKELLEKDVDAHTSIINPLNYKKGVWIKHPAQNNISALDSQEKINIIESFVNKKSYDKPENYDEWLKSNYGEYFSENYPKKYTHKYWTVDPIDMGTEWVGIRMYKPSLREVLEGAFEEETPYLHYANDSGVRYPYYGGFEAFLTNLKRGADIKCNKEVTGLDLKKKKCMFSDGQEVFFDKCIICCPLTEIIPVITNVPESVLNASNALNYTSMVLVSVCLNRRIRNKSGCFYIYDEDILPARVYSTNEYNNVDNGYFAMQAEVYFSKFKPLTESIETIKEKVINQLIRMRVIKEEDIIESEVRFEKYANIIFTHDIYDNKKTIHDYLDEFGILYAGRFGEWDYKWTDQSALSGKKAADLIQID